jgi:hypothetical protein
VAIEGFRGVNNDGDPLILRFNSNAVNSIHAPNGVGKSSIFEALHFAIYGTVPRLASLQEAEQGDSYIVNKFHPAQRATIALAFVSDDGTPDVSITVSRGASGVRSATSPSGYPDPEAFLRALREDFVLVDYTRFARFIDASALERGRSFASLVGLSRYSRLRQVLDGARRTQNINSDLGLSRLEGEVATATRSLATIDRRILSAHNEVTGKSLTLIFDFESLKTAVTASIAEIVILAPVIGAGSVMDLDFDAAEKVIEKEEGGEARKTLDSLTMAITALSGATVEASDLADTDRLIALGEKRDEAVKKVGAASLHSLLQNALAVVTGDDWHDPHQCPVCEAKSDVPLKDRLTAKIALYEEASRLDAELSRELGNSAALSKLQQIEELAAMGIAADARLHLSLSLAVRKGSVTTEELKNAKTRLTSLELSRTDILKQKQAEATALQEKLPPSLVRVTRTLSLAKQFRDAVIEYETNAPELRDKRAKVARINRWKSFITQAAQRFATAESTLANDRLAEIHTVCQTLFGHLVRGGPDVKPTLSRSAISANVDLTLEDFFGLHGLSARALLSESYRNAVAASIFLSAATKHSGVPRFVVLDDVTSSFDAGHQFSLMDALRTRLRHGAIVNGAPITDGIQFIVLSHDTSLEKYFDRLNGTPEWHHQKLQGMPPKGRLMVSAQEADRLKAQAEQYLNAGQVGIGEPFVRQYLEYKLGQVITKLQIPVPPDYATRGDKRTLSTYVDAITDAVSLYGAAHRCVLTPQQISDLQTHHVTSIMSNFISHYETGTGNPFNAYALLGVLQSIDGLSGCFTYTDANGQKRFYRALDRR